MHSHLFERDLHKQDDSALVARIHACGDGWQEAFTILVHRHRLGLLRLCRDRLGNRHDAEDSVQESILRAYLSVRGFKGEAVFRTWLYAIAENQCKTWRCAATVM